MSAQTHLRIAAPSPACDGAEADPLARLARGGVPGYDGLSTAFLPLINLRKDTASIFLCGPLRRQGEEIVFGADALSQSDPKDRASIDEALLEYSLGFARRIVPTKFAAAIVAPVSYETLAWSRGRQLYQKALRAAASTENPFLLVRIENVPPGTPAARLGEIVGMVRPFVKRVFLELPDWDARLMRERKLGVCGLMATVPDGAEPAAVRRVLANAVRFSEAQQALACVTNLSGARQLELARAAGIRFAAGRVSDDSLCDCPPCEPQSDRWAA